MFFDHIPIRYFLNYRYCKGQIGLSLGTFLGNYKGKDKFLAF